MRSNGRINELFVTGGPFIGSNRSRGIVTVEPDYFLNEANVSGKYWPHNPAAEYHRKHRNPVRWFQAKDSSQVEVEIPNVTRIIRDTTLGQDSAGCEIQVVNTRMKTNEGERSTSSEFLNELGDPGWMTFNRGEQRSRDRWRQTSNEWHRVLQPGALLRTYEGYGGHHLTLDESLVTGNLMQTGTWFVDDVTLDSNGGMTLRCRDTAALLIDQLMYPPLVPDGCYPTAFYNNNSTPEGMTGTTDQFNYTDLSSIVALIALWAGFWCKDGKKQPIVYGNIEQTGFVPTAPIGADFFDKRTCSDVINELKALVGYISWVDQEGAFHFESPNYWEKGNFLYDGRHTDDIFDLDEETNLLSYSVNISKKADRSDIYIASSNPELNIPGAKYVHHIWKPGMPGESFGTYLRGQSVPMMVPVKVDMPLNEMNIMAELIHLYLWFARRQGNITIPGNPCIDINDQVRVWERTTSESYYHYVKGIRSNHDLVTGVWTMDLNTNWLGTSENWAIVESSNWHIKYADGGSMAVSPGAFGPYRKGKMVKRRGV